MQEKEDFDFSFNFTYPPKGTGHFTQIVWKGSERMGAGTSKSEKGNMYACFKYDPPGNVVTKFDDNVEREGKGGGGKGKGKGKASVQVNYLGGN